jgi:hypothetical protein
MTQPKFADDKQQFSRKEAARYLTLLGYRISPKTLQNLASNSNAGNGPAFTRVGWNHPVTYDRADLDTWARKRMTKIIHRVVHPNAPA